MQSSAGGVRLQLLDELTAAKRAGLATQLAGLDIRPEQSGFSMKTSAVLEKSAAEPSRRAFAIVWDGPHGSSTVVGIGVLQADAAGAGVWPSGEPHAVLRGFSVDARYQGKGIGAAATAEAVALAGRMFTTAVAVVLTVHVDNIAGQRAYERNDFEYTGRYVSGRAGQERVMARWLNGVAKAAVPD